MHHIPSAIVKVYITCTGLASEILCRLDIAFTKSHLVCNIQCIIIWCQANIRLLLTIRPEDTTQKIKLAVADLEVNYGDTWMWLQGADRPMYILKSFSETDNPKELDHSSYLIRVLTFATSISYNFLTACLIWCLFALTSTMNTSVLLSSIFFMADSVVKGNLMMA